MTYRDDHDAALRRADALAREVDELRRKNEALEKANAEADAERARRAAAEDAAEEAQRELEQLARKKRPEEPAREEPAKPTKPTMTDAEKRVEQALSHAWWIGVVCMVAIVTGPALAIGLLGVPFLVLGFLPGLGLAFLSLTVSQRLLAASDRRWLASLPFELPDYLVYLGREHAADTVMTVRIALDVPRGEPRAVVADAVAGAMPGARAVFEGDDLVIRSPSIWARFKRGKYGSRNQPGNHLLHVWFRRLVRRALLPIARAHEIRRVRVS